MSLQLIRQFCNSHDFSYFDSLNPQTKELFRELIKEPSNNKMLGQMVSNSLQYYSFEGNYN
jgi:hypothetical protein